MQFLDQILDTRYWKLGKKICQFMEFNISPSILVIFGATGDLTRRKLMPSLFDLYRNGVLPKNMRIIGFSRRELKDDEFREMMRRAIKSDAFKFFESVALKYVPGDFTMPAGFEELKKILGRQDNEWQFCANKLFYLAVPPRYYSVILDRLDASGLTEPCGPEDPKVLLPRSRGFQPRAPEERDFRAGGWTRVILEKPFGKDLLTAQKLDARLGKLFREEQIFRIDHFLGKESLQNILAFRFGNAIFEPIWNRHYIDHVQIIVTETLGMEGRGAFYDDIGALRDMVQSHLLQMTAVVAMEWPRDWSAEAIRDERVRVLQAVSTPGRVRWTSDTPGVLNVVRGQYRGYRKEKGVVRNSQTETLVALKLFVNNKRWRGVPFYLLTGKKMKRDLTRIIVNFKSDTGQHFAKKSTYMRAKVSKDDEVKLEEWKRNRIIFEMKPEECIIVDVLMKEPGLTMKVAPHPLKLDYGKIHNHHLLKSYEKLLVDCMIGDQTLFARTDGVMASWSVIEGLLEATLPIERYEPGSWGPAGAKRLIERDGRRWYINH